MSLARWMKFAVPDSVLFAALIVGCQPAVATDMGEQLAGDTVERIERMARGDAEGALTLLDERIASLTGSEGFREKVELYTLRAGITRDLGRLDAAAADAERALAFAEQSADKVLIAESLRVRGTVAAERGRLDAAVEFFHRAWTLLEDTDARAMQLRLAIALGVGHQMMENYERARGHQMSGLELARELGDRAQEATLLGNLALTEAHLEGLDASLTLHQQALQIYRELEHPGGEAYQLANMCDRLVQLQRFDEAGDYCSEAVALADALGHLRLRAGAHGSLATLYENIGDLDAALVEYTKALELARGNVPTVERDFLEQLARLHVQRGNPDEALAVYREYMDAREALWEESRQRTIEELEVQYEVAEREKQLELARTEAALQSMRVRQRTQLLGVMGVAVALLAVFAAMILRSNRIRAGLQRDLAARNEELKAAVRTIGNLANRDPLTQLRNRRSFLEVAEQELARARRQACPVSVMMIDIDRFKPLNDRFGHAAGDEVLQDVSETLRRTLREQDVICRWGGEEFVALLPDTDIESARNAAERARTAVGSIESSGAAEGATISITLGLAAVSRDLHAALEAADRALYEGKRAGRNRVVVADDA